jgi:hypothetical protein
MTLFGTTTVSEIMIDVYHSRALVSVHLPILAILRPNFPDPIFLFLITYQKSFQDHVSCLKIHKRKSQAKSNVKHFWQRLWKLVFLSPRRWFSILITSIFSSICCFSIFIRNIGYAQKTLKLGFWIITLEHKRQFQNFPDFEMAKSGFYSLQRDRIHLNYGFKWSRSQDILICKSEIPIQKKRENVKIDGKFRAPIRNTCKLAKPVSQNCDHLGQK